MGRPNHLPNFTNPPLDEVVLGVQFAHVPDYSSLDSHGIWELFKGDFPKKQEQPLLEPKFETFGGANIQPGVQFQVGGPPVGSRFWFLSDDENHLLQFQRDRFFVNWRNRPSSQEYPRFEGVSDIFENNLLVLSKHFAKVFNYTLDINQAEISYINIIPVDEFSDAGKWFSLWNSEALNIESLNTSFNEVIRGHDEMPFARLTHDIQSVFTVDGSKKGYRLSLSFRGKPEKNDIEAAMKFLKLGREKIVTRFCEITTGKAHKFWGKFT